MRLSAVSNRKIWPEAVLISLTHSINEYKVVGTWLPY